MSDIFSWYVFYCAFITVFFPLLSCYYFFKYPFSQLFFQPIFLLEHLTKFVLLRILTLYLGTCSLYTSSPDLLAPHMSVHYFFYFFLSSLYFETVLPEGEHSSSAHCPNVKGQRDSDQEKKMSCLIRPLEVLSLVAACILTSTTARVPLGFGMIVWKPHGLVGVEETFGKHGPCWWLFSLTFRT